MTICMAYLTAACGAPFTRWKPYDWHGSACAGSNHRGKLAAGTPYLSRTFLPAAWNH